MVIIFSSGGLLSNVTDPGLHKKLWVGFDAY